MFKKFLAMIVAIAMLATMFIVPSTVTASDIELPTGSWMTLKATEVESFKAGDTVEITYTISDVDPEIYLLTIDLYFEHSDALVPVIDSFTDTCAAVNAATAEDDAWEMLKRVDEGEGIYIGLMEDSDNYLGSNQSDVLAFTLVFTATRDSVPGENLVWSTDVSLMSIDFEEDMGNGVLVKAAGEAATPVPTEEPTPVPTPEPTPVPTAKPFNSEGKLVDIDFTTSDEDKAGSLTYTKTNLDCPWYTGNVRLTDEFTIEFMAKFGVGLTMFSTGYSMEVGQGGSYVESWLVGPNKPYVSYDQFDANEHHIVLTADGNAYSMYIDGVLVSQDAESEIPASTIFAPGEIALGHGATEKKMFRIYDTAATADDVAALYEAATYVPEVTPEPTPEPTEKPAFDVNAPVIDIDYSTNRVVDKKGVLTFGRDASAARFVNLKDYGYDIKALDNSAIGNSLKYTGGDVDTSEGLVIELFGVFKTNEQFLGKGYWSAECNADGTFGFWETLVGGDAYICSATSVADGKAHHIVLVSDGAVMKLYIDGQLDATKDWAQKYNTLTGGNWYLNYTGGTPYTVRNRIWNGANMQMPTAEDIAAMYAAYPKYVAKEYTGALIIDSKADKLIYEYGEAFDATGFAASKIIVNGEVIDITGDVTVDASAFNPTVAGKYAIKISYEYESDIYTNVFTVKVNEAPYVRSIALAAKPVKLIYAAGEELDLTGLAVTAYSTDGTVETITEGIEVTGYDANTVGVQKVTATYAGRTTTFSVKVI